MKIIIPNLIQKLDFGGTKTPGLSHRKWIPRINIDPFAMIQPTELSKINFELRRYNILSKKERFEEITYMK